VKAATIEIVVRTIFQTLPMVNSNFVYYTPNARKQSGLTPNADSDLKYGRLNSKQGPPIQDVTSHRAHRASAVGCVATRSLRSSCARTARSAT
jgi:hypothetical protein